MIVRIVPIVPVVSKNVQAIGTIIWKHFPDDRRRSQTTRTIGTITIVRIELCSIRTIAHDRGDREKSEAIKWKHSQTIGTIGTIGTIEVYPRKHHSRHHLEDCLGVREFSPKWRQRRSSTLLYLWKRYRNTSACTTNFQRIIRTSSHD